MPSLRTRAKLVADHLPAISEVAANFADPLLGSVQVMIMLGVWSFDEWRKR